MQELENSLLGKKASYKDQYDPSLLFPIPRKSKRDEIGASQPNLFFGKDIWNAYEISFLNSKGKPVVAIGEFCVPADSPALIESKSLKLYLNSFNNSRFASLTKVEETIAKDLTEAANKAVEVKLTLVKDYKPQFAELNGYVLDDLDIECTDFALNKSYLKTEVGEADEALVSHLLKSNCLVTGQPDWASIRISYKGKKLDRAGLLRYLTSFRNHNEFHEQCIERIFMDIKECCSPSFLAIEARYTRRGGLDINPCRSSEADYDFGNPRLARQ